MRAPADQQTACGPVRSQGWQDARVRPRRCWRGRDAGVRCPSPPIAAARYHFFTSRRTRGSPPSFRSRSLFRSTPYDRRHDCTVARHLAAHERRHFIGEPYAPGRVVYDRVGAHCAPYVAVPKGSPIPNLSRTASKSAIWTALIVFLRAGIGWAGQGVGHNAAHAGASKRAAGQRA